MSKDSDFPGDFDLNKTIVDDNDEDRKEDDLSKLGAHGGGPPSHNTRKNPDPETLRTYSGGLPLGAEEFKKPPDMSDSQFAAFQAFLNKQQATINDHYARMHEESIREMEAMRRKMDDINRASRPGAHGQPGGQDIPRPPPHQRPRQDFAFGGNFGEDINNRQASQSPSLHQDVNAGLNRILESDLTSHLWFEMPRFASGRAPEGCNPWTSKLSEFLAYWNEKRLSYGSTSKTVERAIRYLAPKSKAVFDDATAMSRLRHVRTDWTLFKDTLYRVFQVSRADVVGHPLRDNNWLLRLPSPQSNTRHLPRNQALRIYCNVALKPLKNISEMLFDPNEHITDATIIKSYSWLHDLKLIGNANPVMNHNVDMSHRIFIMMGAAWALQLQALATFKFHAIPAQSVDQYSDTLEKCLDLSLHNTNCIMEDTIEVLATFLTTQASISGLTLADRAKSVGANQACAAVSYRQPTQAQNAAPTPSTESSTTSKTTEEDPEGEIMAINQKNKRQKQQNKSNKSQNQDKSKQSKQNVNSLAETNETPEEASSAPDHQNHSEETASQISGCSWFKN